MSAITRILSRPTAKGYRHRDLDEKIPYLNNDGYVDFTETDVQNPHNWSLTRRCYVSFVAVMLVGISREFDISREAAALTITLFLLGYAAGPLIFAPLSEFYGRRWIFYITFSLYIVFNFLCAFAPNFGSLLLGRFLTGTFVSAPLSNGPGVLADLWAPLQRGNALAAFACMTWVGPALGPVVAGFLDLNKDWRWIFYVMLWLAGGTFFLMFTLPETYGPAILSARARRIRNAKLPGYEKVMAGSEDSGKSLVQVYKVALTRPWIILFDPISLCCAIYLSIVYMLLYMLYTIYPIVFQKKRGWNAGMAELPLIGTVLGAVLASSIVVMDTMRMRKKVESGHKHEPEDRLPLAMVGGVGLAVSMFWFAWTAEFISIHWIVPTIAGGFLSGSMMLIFVAFLNYIVDTYGMYAASAIAANTVCRSACGASAPLWTNFLFDALGVGGGGSLIGGIASVLAVIPFAFHRYGSAIRVRSRFAPTDAPAPDEEEGRRDTDSTLSGEMTDRTAVDRSGSGLGLVVPIRAEGTRAERVEGLGRSLGGGHR